MTASSSRVSSAQANAVPGAGFVHARSIPTGEKRGFVQLKGRGSPPTGRRRPRNPSLRSRQFNTDQRPGVETGVSVYGPMPIGVVMSVWISLALNALPYTRTSSIRPAKCCP